MSLRTTLRALMIGVALLGVGPSKALAEGRQPTDQAVSFEDFGRSGPARATLEFLADADPQATHTFNNRVLLSRASRRTGWAELRQCHRDLDAVPATEIVYRSGRVRDIRVIEDEGIGQVKVNDASVELRDVSRDAYICLATESRILEPTDDEVFILRNGPFMRQFLDGYFPMHVRQVVRLGNSGLRYAGIEPNPQPGFEVANDPEGIVFDAYFTGRLDTRIRLVPAESAR